ncbi:MAG: NfeD family protein [Bradyrhizobiaceae bacterium]|nr:NfeD family protein [Bradyrhizobiaceae bacterium]
MTAEQIWLAAAILLFILEIFTPGFVLANFGVASMVAAGAAWIGGDLVMQVSAFVLTCFLSFITLRPFLRNTFEKNMTNTPTGVDALIDREAIVTEAIPGGLQYGRVQIDGDSWRAIADDRQPVELGAAVRILSVDTTTLTIKRI